MNITKKVETKLTGVVIEMSVEEAKRILIWMGPLTTGPSSYELYTGIGKALNESN